jgi:hypothetical protein
LVARIDRTLDALGCESGGSADECGKRRVCQSCVLSRLKSRAI